MRPLPGCMMVDSTSNTSLITVLVTSPAVGVSCTIFPSFVKSIVVVCKNTKDLKSGQLWTLCLRHGLSVYIASFETGFKLFKIIFQVHSPIHNSLWRCRYISVGQLVYKDHDWILCSGQVAYTNKQVHKETTG